MKDFNIGINDAPLTLCHKIIDVIFLLKQGRKAVTLELLYSHLGKTTSYIDKAINLLKLIDLIKQDGVIIDISPDIFKLLLADDSRINEIILSNITELDPFVTFCSIISKGKSELESAKFVCTIYNIKKKPELIQSILTKWVKLTGIDVRVEARPTGFDLAKHQRDALKARIFLHEILDNNFIKINKNSITDFVEAITEYNSDPKKAMNDLGRGFEDFLRIDYAPDINLKKASGIGQIGNELMNKSKIHPKHHHLIGAISSVRSMGDAHGVDKNSSERWELEVNTAFSAILLTLNSINSLLLYKNSGLLKL